MKISNYFIDDDLVFQRWEKLLNSRLWLNQRFPEQVFKNQFKYFGFEEFDWLPSGQLWSVLKDINQAVSDKECIVAVLDPSPTEYFRKHFGKYNWSTISMDATEDEYWSLLNEDPGDSPADSILFNSTTVVWTSESGQWVIWGDRDFEICVYAAVNPIGDGHWRDCEWAMDRAAEYVSSEFDFDAFSKTFKSNYLKFT